MITVELINLYKKYGGDQDGVLRVGSLTEKTLLNNGGWMRLSVAYQDIELIAKRLYSDKLAVNVLIDLESVCDKNSYTKLTALIPFYHDFQNVADIMTIMKSKVNHQLEKEVEDNIWRLRFCDFEILNKIRSSFLSANRYYELANQEGWQNEYLRISENFNKFYKDILNKNSSLLKSFEPEQHKASNIFSKLSNWFFSKLVNI